MVSIIVLNYNGWRHTIECLESVLSIYNSTEYRIIVVDNNSTDESLESIRNWASGNLKNDDIFSSRFPAFTKASIKPIHINEVRSIGEEFIGDAYVDSKITLILSSINGGYAYGNNLGIKYSSIFCQENQYIWILNNDVVVDPMALNFLLSAYEKNPGLIGSAIRYYYQPNKLQGFGCIYNNKYGTVISVGESYSSDGYYDDFIYNIDYIIGASIFTSKYLLEKTGLLCEDYFLYYEELDICLRAKACNIAVYCSTKSVIYHKVGSTIGSSESLNSRTLLSDYWYLKNQIIVTRKFFPKSVFSIKISLFLKIFNRVLKGNLRAAIQAWKIFLRSC